MENEIIKFIEDFKSRGSGLEEVFLDGYCYYFAVILKERFNFLTIIYDPIKSHFITKFQDRYYDITGEITHNLDISNLIRWDLYNDTIHRERIERDIILKREVEG